MATSKTQNTLRAYASAWKIFRAWCHDAGRDAVPASPRTVCQFAAWTINSGLRLQTVQLRVKAISFYHREANRPTPTHDPSVRVFLRNAARDRKERPAGKAAVTEEHIRRIARLKFSTPAQMRNRTILLLGFATGWRRSELIALDTCDIEFVRGKGLLLWQRSSKTDQEGKGRAVGIQPGAHEITCPVLAVKSWLKLRGDWSGPLFTSVARDGVTLTHERLAARGDTVRLALKEAIERVGENPRNFGAHSLRAGHVTTAFEHGVSLQAIKLRTGHKDTKTMERYIRVTNAFKINTMAGVL